MIVRNVYRPTDFKGRISQRPFLPNDAFDGRSGITEGKGSICESFPFNSTRDSFHVAVLQKKDQIFFLQEIKSSNIL